MTSVFLLCISVGYYIFFILLGRTSMLCSISLFVFIGVRNPVTHGGCIYDERDSAGKTREKI